MAARLAACVGVEVETPVVVAPMGLVADWCEMVTRRSGGGELAAEAAMDMIYDLEESQLSVSEGAAE